ncbi:MAG TPA: SDR family oxidoreductase, partial [Candidatus Limnocylindrales bacterium]|nr:SDR family oxidoreductase [Candidatus Limnocylindrales bacterium]
FELHVADTRDEAIVWQLLRRSGSVIHLGEIVGDQACDLDPAVTISVNYTATVGLAEMASSAGVERFIYPSSCSVYGTNDEIVDEDAPLNPLSLYGRLKQASELAILDIRGDTFHPTIFRLATVYGLSPRPRFDLVVNTLAGRAAAEGEIVVQGGGQWRPFVHVADVARVMVGTLKAPLDAVDGEIFNLGSNTQNDTIAGIADIVCSRLPSVALAVTDGMDRRNYRVAFDKIADVLAFQPTRTIDDGVSEIVDAVQGGAIADVRAARHSNVRALIETEARSRLWREDLADGVPANPFRPRDLEEPIPLPIPLHEVREGAVS